MSRQSSCNAVQAADYNVSGAQRGIVYIDRGRQDQPQVDNPSINPRRPSGEGVQQALLKIMEGTVASVPPQGRGASTRKQEFLQV